MKARTWRTPYESAPWGKCCTLPQDWAGLGKKQRQLWLNILLHIGYIYDSLHVSHTTHWIWKLRKTSLPRKDFPLTEIFFRVIDWKLLNSYLVSNPGTASWAGIQNYKDRRKTFGLCVWCNKQWRQLLFSPISQGKEEAKHLRMKKRNLRLTEWPHPALLEAGWQCTLLVGHFT